MVASVSAALSELRLLPEVKQPSILRRGNSGFCPTSVGCSRCDAQQFSLSDVLVCRPRPGDGHEAAAPPPPGCSPCTRSSADHWVRCHCHAGRRSSPRSKAGDIGHPDHFCGRAERPGRLQVDDKLEFYLPGRRLRPAATCPAFTCAPMETGLRGWPCNTKTRCARPTRSLMSDHAHL
jgi:hypothetical protein